jgi:hypothetical protein
MRTRKTPLKPVARKFGLSLAAAPMKWDSEANQLKWAKFQRLQRSILLTAKRIEDRRQMSSLQLPAFLTSKSPSVRYRNLKKYREGLMKSVSTHNHQLFSVTWERKLTALFFAAMTVYGINNCEAMVKYVNAFDKMDASILNARTNKMLKVSCVKYLSG